MVCDAGRATTDLTSYTIRRLHPLQIVDVVSPLSKTTPYLQVDLYVRTNKLSARPGGSLNLNKNFESHTMRNLLEEEEFIRLKKSLLFLETLKQFDQEIKPVFSSLSTRQFTVKLKGTKLTDYLDGNLKNDTMTLDRYGLFWRNKFRL
jgi:hypothetical protein